LFVIAPGRYYSIRESRGSARLRFCSKALLLDLGTKMADVDFEKTGSVDRNVPRGVPAYRQALNLAWYRAGRKGQNIK